MVILLDGCVDISTTYTAPECHINKAKFMFIRKSQTKKHRECFLENKGETHKLYLIPVAKLTSFETLRGKFFIVLI